MIFPPAPARAGNTCASIKPFKSRVNIELTTPADPYYKQGQKLADIQSPERVQEWLEENGLKGIWSADGMTTLGVTAGGSSSVWKMNLHAKPVDRYGVYYCVYFQDIDLEFFYRSMIIIPEEFSNKTCDYDVINEHELRHHVANKQAVELYIDRLRQDIMVMLRDMESGYVPRARVQARMDEMQQGMRDAVEIYLGEYLSAEAQRLNALIDTPEEYASHDQRVRECQKK